MNEIFKKPLSMLSGLVLLAMFSAPVSATVVAPNTVMFSQGNIINANAGDTLTLELRGYDFTLGPDGAAFSLSWDPLVLSYVGSAVANPPWDSSFMSEENAGVIDYVFLNKLTAGDAGNSFAIASFTFNVLGAVGSETTIGIGNPAFDDTGFTLPSGTLVDVNYVNSQVRVVPLPAAAWLFGVGLAGLLGPMGRRKQV
ncbi:hypothetical protein NP590_09175 [Methylomonas sp. SURF-2]|uniref:Cohesin domain-containing protein n=1 Tax=Methylomonas subterranea TaxID=2952225 RepID=A0ABT1TFP1_9GAMM|nr:hypothetical protein [Methylomonas sp. SURF-2]MCQ8104276.1 hypothetical protein [Methylomonas sp. SURF-2]